MYFPFSLKNKRILVTGASSGIGRATAIECSRMGASLIVSGRNEDRLRETLGLLEGTNHLLLTADLTDSNQLLKVVEDCDVLDGAVLSAGRGGNHLPLKFCDRAKFMEVAELNFFSTAELATLLFKKKKLKPWASVVLISSIGGTRNFLEGHGAYGISKAALESFMKYAAKEFASRKIRVNSICPGMIETPLIENGILSSKDLESDKSRYPLKRYGRTEEVAYGVIYLLSDASAWVTGNSLVIDGGLSIG